MKKLINTIKSFFISLRKLYVIFEKKQRLQSIFLFVGVFVCAMLETLGVSAIIPFVLVLFSPDEMLENKYVKLISDMFGVSNYHRLLLVTAGLIVGIYLVKNIILLVFKYYQGKFHNDIECSLTIKLYTMFMNRPYAYYLNANTAEVIRGITNDIIQVAQVLDGFLGVFSEGFTILLIGIFVVYLDPIMALGLIGTAVFLVLLFAFGFKKKTTELGMICRDVFAKRNKTVMESVSGYKEISVYQKKKFFIDDYSDVSRFAARKNTLNLFIMTVPYYVIETVFIASLLGLTCYKISSGSDTTTYATLISTLVVAAVRILPSISNISKSFNILTYNHVGLDAAYDNIVEVKDSAEAKDLLKVPSTEEDSIRFTDNIVLKDVSFRYPNTDKDVFSSVDITINKNNSVAFVGESGAGKTTLLDVLLGLLEPHKGEILMDGKDIRTIPFAWAKTIGYVPQSVYMIDDTIRKNIAFGISEDEIDDNRIWEVLKDAQLDEFIKNLPDGLDTMVGERGIRFSGGQRQRISIARAMYHDPHILVLDEATSALDNETEKEVMNAIDRLHGKMTIIIVAHRLSNIENCDIVYRVGDGKIIKERSKE